MILYELTRWIEEGRPAGATPNGGANQERWSRPIRSEQDWMRALGRLEPMQAPAQGQSDPELAHTPR